MSSGGLARFVATGNGLQQTQCIVSERASMRLSGEEIHPLGTEGRLSGEGDGI